MLQRVLDLFKREPPTPTPTPNLITFRYYWMNLKTGRRGIRTIELRSKQEFIVKLAEWNRLEPFKWKYWEVVDNQI